MIANFFPRFVTLAVLPILLLPLPAVARESAGVKTGVQNRLPKVLARVFGEVVQE